MNNLFLLMKNQWNCLIGKLGKKSGKSTTGILTLIFGAISIFSIQFLQANSILLSLGKGFGVYILFQGISIMLSALVVYALMRCITPTKTNDSDLLLSLPLKKREIVFAKTLSLYIFDFSITAIICIPYFLVYFINSTFAVLPILMSVLLVFIAPFFSVGISYIFSFVVNKLFNKCKHAKIYKSIFSTICILAVVAVICYISIGGIFTDSGSLTAFMSIMKITSYILNFIISTNILNCAVVLSIPIAVFVIGFWLNIKLFGKAMPSYTEKSTYLKFSEKQNIFSVYYKKEAKNFVCSPIYLTNTIFAPVIEITLAIVALFVGGDLIMQIFGGNLAMIICVPSILITMCCISSCSISMEGKSFFINKVLPVSSNVIFGAKVLFQLTLTLIPTLFMSIVIIALTALPAWAVFVPLCACVAMAVIGLMMNIKFPKFDFENEMQVVKQSMSVLLAMLAGLVIAFVPFVLNLIGLNFTLNLILSIILYITITAIITIYLVKNGNKIICKL